VEKQFVPIQKEKWIEFPALAEAKGALQVDALSLR
jgi:hypothetical protein